MSDDLEGLGCGCHRCQLAIILTRHMRRLGLAWDIPDDPFDGTAWGEVSVGACLYPGSVTRPSAGSY